MYRVYYTLSLITTLPPEVIGHILQRFLVKASAPKIVPA
jgi:hypothetical protein